GRNRNHQGLAAAIVKLWEKSLVVKIAVKRGIQNTNNKLMSEEIKVWTPCCCCFDSLTGIPTYFTVHRIYAKEH
ncbi:Os05g0551900, partial [Oryza sativa Japonica Group]